MDTLFLGEWLLVGVVLRAPDDTRCIPGPTAKEPLAAAFETATPFVA